MAKSAKKSKKRAPVQKKAPVKAKPVKKKAAPAAKARKPVPVRKPVAARRRPAPKAAPEPKKPLPPPRRLPAVELKKYREVLQRLRDRVVDEISFLAGDNLNRSPRESSGDLSSYSFHMADQGTDNFDREFALNLVSSEQDALYEIDEALQRITTGIYGSCDNCGKPI
ncbi:MAG TPA: hypothetical protein PK634_13910, partial [Kiritimatiellia bacterium]|nr:hypothetical protein [Kiritimatiellia bacterium]